MELISWMKSHKKAFALVILGLVLLFFPILWAGLKEILRIAALIGGCLALGGAAHLFTKPKKE